MESKEAANCRGVKTSGIVKEVQGNEEIRAVYKGSRREENNFLYKPLKSHGTQKSTACGW
jgi:hypothetical protein